MGGEVDPLVRHRTCQVNGIRLHYVEAGAADTSRPPVVLLHGFPEFWYGWRHQIPALVTAGFRVIALDMRGYNESAKPSRVSDYTVEAIASDVVALIRQQLGGRAHVVGHDWGGVIAWHLAMHAAAVVDRLVILNAPHPAAFLREVRRLSTQVLRSWYAVMFQVPWLPEAMIRFGNFGMLRRLFRNEPLRREGFTDADIERYVEAFRQPGALTSAINYYRAAFRRGPSHLARAVRRIDRAVLLIWGERDRYLVRRLTDGLEQWVPQIRVERFPHATHWVQHDEPERVNRLITAFLT